MKVIVNTPGDDLAAWIGVAGVGVGVLLTTVVEWLRDRRGLARVGGASYSPPQMS